MSRKMIVFCILMLFYQIVIAGCSQSAPSAEDIEAAIAQTQASLPTQTPSPTNTPFTVKDIYLDTIIFLPGDLPIDTSAGQIKNKLPEELIGILPTPDKVVHQIPGPAVLKYFGVIIMLYESLDVRNEAYDQLLYYSDTFEDSSTPRFVNELDSVGEKAFIAGFGEDGGRYNPLIGFYRCNALVFIEFYDFLRDVDGEITITYAQRLDSRLEPLVCQ